MAYNFIKWFIRPKLASVNQKIDDRLRHWRQNVYEKSNVSLKTYQIYTDAAVTVRVHGVCDFLSDSTNSSHWVAFLLCQYCCRRQTGTSLSYTATAVRRSAITVARFFTALFIKDSSATVSIANCQCLDSFIANRRSSCCCRANLRDN